MTNKFSIDGETVRKLAEILVDTDLTEIEIEDNGCRVYVSRRQNITVPVNAPAPMPMATPAAMAAAPAPIPTASLAQHQGAVKSPMVGTAYLAAEPGSAPFVKVGDSVKEGQTLLIVEAMKVMNPIKSPKSGTITQLLAQDATPVEFGEVLMIIE